MRRVQFITFLLFIFNLNCLANAAVSFTYISREHGLSDNNVECIFKDSEGFVWFGTRNGLCRFDGYEIKVYKKREDKNSLSGNRILDIKEDKEGFLWIGTYKDGLNKFNKTTEVFEHFGTEKGIGERINKIRVLNDSSIWVASNKGIAKIRSNENSISVFSYTEGLNSSSVYDVLESRNGDIYIATDHADIQKWNTLSETFENVSYKRDHELNSNYRKQLIEDNDGIIWITASYHGLCWYNPFNGESDILTQQNHGLSTNILIGSMDLDKEGNLWICTEEDGINILNISTKTYKHLVYEKNQPASLNTNQTYSVYFDNENIAWIGTFNKGVNVFNPYQKKFQSSLFEPNDLSMLDGLSVLDVFEDSRQSIWIGTDGNGIFRFARNKQPQHYTIKENPELLTSNVITSINEDPQGNILIGMYSGGLSVFSPVSNEIDKFIANGASGAISSPHVWDIIRDSKEQVWLGMLASGVDGYLYQDKTFKNYGPFSNENKKVNFQNVMVIMEDSNGDLWFGTEGRGLFIWDNETDKVLRLQHDSIHNFTTQGVIKTLYQDEMEAIWIGTEGDGLFKYDKRKGSFEKYNTQNGFTDEPVQSIMGDLQGNIWIGTSSGLFNYNRKKNAFRRFIVEDGLSSNDFNADAMVLLSDGRILAGTKNGVDIIGKDDIVINAQLPKIVFTKLTVLGNELKPGMRVNNRVILSRSINTTQELILNWKDKVFTLEFAALNYTLPKKCNYKYKLEGFDEQWIFTPSNRRVATYSNLDAGEYVFKVYASNNDGLWGENAASIKILVKPPFWDTMAFKILIISLLIALIYSIYRSRITKQKEAYKQKTSEQEKKIMSLENEQLEVELKKLAFNILNKNRLLLEQKQRLESLSHKAKIEVKEGLKKIVEKIDDDLDEEKDWKVIEPQIDKAYNQFISHLKEKHADLTATEIRIAAYIRMNLSTKEICEIMNKTQRAIENDRYRLRKKIGIEANDSLKDYFLKL